MEETVLNTIRNEHSRILDQMALIAECQDLRTKEELYTYLKSLLLDHMEGEEMSIYKRLREDIENNSASKVINASDIEHHEIREYLQRLNLIDMNKINWGKVFLDFKEVVKKHCEKEENEMFSEAKEDFSGEELAQMLSEYENSKRATNLKFIF